MHHQHTGDAVQIEGHLRQAEEHLEPAGDDAAFAIEEVEGKRADERGQRHGDDGERLEHAPCIAFAYSVYFLKCVPALRLRFFRGFNDRVGQL